MSESETSSGALPAIAVIGMAGRFPGAPNIDVFWRNLENGVESISFFTADMLRKSGVQEDWLSNPRYVKANGVLADIDLFDAEFFDFTPREAEITDPQHRVLLECAWESLENAGYDSDRCAGRIGVYAGAGISTYLLRHLISRNRLPAGVTDFQILMGNNKDYVPTRISYKLNLTGPSLNINTACSTSLVAVHLACQGLLDYHCDMALAGGVGIQVPQLQGYWYEDGGIGSPDGHCRAFDARAGGTVGGNGAGMVVLKRLADAVADGDCIRAIIKGSAVNNDGHAKAGYTAPSVGGQADVIAEALALAGVAPESIGYVETHGTGTALGDPIELAALTQAFRAGTRRKQYCAIGSVKTNIGHLDEAAGVAGLIKTVLALEHRKIPPSLHFERPNPAIDFESSPFFVNTGLADWVEDSPRRAGVSSFGIGGTNAHVIVEEAPARPASIAGRRWQILPLSARSPSALEAASSNLAGHLRELQRAGTWRDAPGESAWLADAGYTLSIGRRAFTHRRVIVSGGVDGALADLQAPESGAMFTGVSDGQDRPVVFLFPGQGAQHVRMGAELYRHERRFRHHLDQCADILRHRLGYDFRDWLYPPNGADAGHPGGELNRTSYAQPVLFSIEYALARLLTDWGIQPQAMVGHSLGEYVAACLAGVFSLEDGLALVAARGALMEPLDGGRMLAIPFSEAETRAMLPQDVWVAACNGPSLTTVSGSVHAIQQLHQRLADRGIGCHLLTTSHAFHSAMMDPILPSLFDLMKRTRLRSPTLPYLSNVTGDWATPDQAIDPMYWVTHSRQTVRFGESLEKVFGGSHPILLEVGPGRNLTSAALRHPGRPARQSVYTTLPSAHDRNPDDRVLLSAIGQLWSEGVPIDWPAFYADERRYRVPLPTQPFDRQRYWIEAGASPPPASPADKNEDIGSWFYAPSWQRSVLPPPAAGEQPASLGGRWLLFIDDPGLGHGLAERLEQSGGEIITVSMGRQFERVGPARYVIDPSATEHYASLLAELSSRGAGPDRIVHLWSLTSNRQQPSWHDALDRGFYSLLFLAQAVRDLPIDRDVAIDVVSSGIHDVIGGETLCPAAATLLGPVKVIPQERPNISCRSIDIPCGATEPSADGHLVERLYDELASNRRDSVIAWRGPHRWKQCFEPVRIAETNGSTSRLKVGGVYLVTGGLGGVGTILSEYLAREYKARLALVSRAGLPDAVPASTSELGADTLDGELAATPGRQPILVVANRAGEIASTAQRIASQAGARQIGDYTGFTRAANQLCASYIYHYLQSSGLPDRRRGSLSSRQELMRSLRIQSRFAKFFDFFLRVLQEGSIIACADDGTIEFLREVSDLEDPESARTALVRQFPDFTGIIALVAHCARHYPAALSGDIEAISVLYPEGSSALLEEAGRSTNFRSHRDVYIAVLQELLRDVCRKSPDRPIRILEVGIGDGILTRSIAPNLPSNRLEYWATDISRTFVVRAEKEAGRAGLDFMKFAVFDIAKGPVPKEIEPASVDVILGLDVVHATPRIEETLTTLKPLLVPGGVLALVETVAAHRWVDMIWGLADGWWSFEDADLRRHSPLLGLSEWESVIRRAGFESVQAHPLDPGDREKADYGLILAQLPVAASARRPVSSNDPVIRRRVSNLQKLEELGSEVLVLAADVGDEEQMARAVAATRERFGPIDGVIHAAGVTRGDVVFNLLEETTRAGAETLFRSKIQGSIVLAQVLQDEPLDFCLLVSSNAAILGGVGFSAYAAANLFMDAFATAHSRKTAQRWISANWDGWPTEESSAGTVQFQTSIDRFAMTRAECEQAFERVLAQSSPNLVVSSADLNTRLQLWTSRATGTSHHLPIAAANEVAGPGEPGSANGRHRAAPGHSSLHLRPGLSSDYRSPGTPTEERLCAIWQEMFGIDRIGVDDSFFELRGDSLLATQVIANASRAFNIPIPMRSIFEHSSVSSLAKLVDDLAAAATLLTRIPAHHLADGEEEGSI